MRREIIGWHPSTTDRPRPSHHDGSDVFGIVSVQVELECHHLVIVRLQLTLHHAVHFIRELQRQTGSVTASFRLLSKPASKAEHKRNSTFLCVSAHMKMSLAPLHMVCTPHVCYMHWSHCCFSWVYLSCLQINRLIWRESSVLIRNWCHLKKNSLHHIANQTFMMKQTTSKSYCTPVMRSLDRTLLLNIFPAVFLAAVFSLFSDRPS